MVTITLNRKLWRDLWQLRGQVITIALVIAVGIASLLGAMSTRYSLIRAQNNFYQQAHFADGFARLKRAPKSLVNQLLQIPGISQLETRLVDDMNLDLPAMSAPAIGRFISLPPRGQPRLNQLVLKAGRWPAPHHNHEILINQAFADAHQLRPGNSIVGIVNGRRQNFLISGIANSPEYIYAFSGQEILPDNKHFAVIWAQQDALEAALGMKEAFNDVVFALQPNVVPRAVIAKMDKILEPFGGFGATSRQEQMSHRFVSDEIRQLSFLARIIPGIFLAVAVFLLNIVTARLIALQRSQIATLKAVGYHNRQLAWYYFKLVAIIVLLGASLGLGFGVWMGQSMTTLYHQYFVFPDLHYSLEPRYFMLGFAVSFTAALSGAGFALRRITALTPSAAMRPPAPMRYQAGIIDKLLQQIGASPMTKMIIRYCRRRPLRTLLTAIGIGTGVAIVILGWFWRDAMNTVINTQFTLAERHMAVVQFREPVNRRALNELKQLSGVLSVEGFRVVPIRIHAAAKRYQTVLYGFPEQGQLRLLLDDKLKTVSLAQHGLMISRGLADELKLSRGSNVHIEVLEGKRVKQSVEISQIIDDYMGLPCYLSLTQLEQLLKETSTVNGAHLLYDDSVETQLLKELKAIPSITTIRLKQALSQVFADTFAKHILVFTGFLMAFAIIIAVGVVYNNARITLSERQWELASLRVLGFTEQEVSKLLFGAFAIETALGIPLGIGFGISLAAIMIQLVPSDIFRIPLVIEPSTLLLASSVVVIAGLLSALIVRAKIATLDLTSVLRTLE